MGPIPAGGRRAGGQPDIPMRHVIICQVSMCFQDTLLGIGPLNQRPLFELGAIFEIQLLQKSPR